MKIGIFGGTFNPIHNAHIRLAQEFLNFLQLDHVIFIPTFLPPHKTAPDLASAEDRFKMCTLATESIPGFMVSAYEIEKQGTSYTYETLEHFQGKFQDSEFFLLMGSDMFLTLEQWKNPQRIFELATLCVIPREADELETLEQHRLALQKQGAQSIVLPVAAQPMSSTEIRRRLFCGKMVDDYLDLKVIHYILENHLYENRICQTTS